MKHDHKRKDALGNTKIVITTNAGKPDGKIIEVKVLPNDSNENKHSSKIEQDSLKKQPNENESIREENNATKAPNGNLNSTQKQNIQRDLTLGNEFVEMSRMNGSNGDIKLKEKSSDSRDNWIGGKINTADGDTHNIVVVDGSKLSPFAETGGDVDAKQVVHADGNISTKAQSTNAATGVPSTKGPKDDFEQYIGHGDTWDISNDNSSSTFPDFSANVVSRNETAGEGNEISQLGSTAFSGSVF